MCTQTDTSAPQVSWQPSTTAGFGRHKIQERVAHVPASRSGSGCVELPPLPCVLVVHKSPTPASTDRERGAKVRWNEHRDCGVEKRTKTEWWDSECLDQQVKCAVNGDCSHSTREMREWRRTTRLQLTLRDHKDRRHRVKLGM